MATTFFYEAADENKLFLPSGSFYEAADENKLFLPSGSWRVRIR